MERRFPAHSGLLRRTAPRSFAPAFDDSAWPVTTRSGVELTHSAPARDQGDKLRCCVSAAIATCMEALEERQLSDSGERPQAAHTPLSMMFHYYVAREKLGKSASLVGMTLAHGILVAEQVGYCTQDNHNVRIDESGAAEVPDERIRDLARARRIAEALPTAGSEGYWRLPDDEARPRAWERALQNGFPILCGFFTSDSYQRLGDRQGNNVLIQTNESGSGGNAHAVSILGYGDLEGVGRAFLVKDSRGDRIGSPARPGYWWLPKAGVQPQAEVVFEAYAIAEVDYPSP